jgi:hypothetical protein
MRQAVEHLMAGHPVPVRLEMTGEDEGHELTGLQQLDQDLGEGCPPDADLCHPAAPGDGNPAI